MNYPYGLSAAERWRIFCERERNQIPEPCNACSAPGPHFSLVFGVLVCWACYRARFGS